MTAPRPRTVRATGRVNQRPVEEIADFRHYLAEISREGLLNKEEEADLSRRVLDEGDRDAENVLVGRNLRLVVNIAKHFHRSGIDMEDLIAFGNEGLMAAAKKFDYRRGTRFSTYASLWIRQAISRGIAETSRTIRMPTYMSDHQRQMHRVYPELLERFGRPPTQGELATALGLSVEKIDLLQKYVQSPLSLDRATGDEDSEVTLANVLPDPTQDIEQHIEDIDVRSAVMVALQRSAISERDCSIFLQRFGEDKTLEDIARDRGLTRERIRQIVKKCQEHLAASLPRELVEEYTRNRRPFPGAGVARADVAGADVAWSGETSLGV